MSCSPSASARTVTAHSLKAIGIEKGGGRLQLKGGRAASRAAQSACYEARRGGILRNGNSISSGLPGRSVFNRRHHRREVAPSEAVAVRLAVELLGGRAQARG